MLRRTNTGSSSGDAAESIRRESHNPLVRQLDKDRSPLSPHSRRYGFGFLVGDAHRISPPRDRRVQRPVAPFPSRHEGKTQQLVRPFLPHLFKAERDEFRHDFRRLENR